MPDDDLLDEQLRYYGARAPHYDDAYTRTGHNDRGPEANAAWFAELAIVEAAVDELDLSGDVLELGCGTGHWTLRMAARARRVTAVDGSPEVLEVARAKLDAAGVANVDLVHGDIIRTWAPPRRSADAVAAFFFLEHVPDEHLDGVLAKAAAALRPGGQVIVAEGHRRDAEMPDVEHRHLHEVEYRVVERRRTADEFVAAFASHGLDVTVEHTERLFAIVRGSLSG